MAWENKCEYCGANLDTGEKCDCQKKKHIISINKHNLLTNLKCPVCGSYLYSREFFIRTHDLEAVCCGCKTEYSISLKENYIIKINKYRG